MKVREEDKVWATRVRLLCAALASGAKLSQTQSATAPKQALRVDWPRKIEKNINWVGKHA